MKTRDWKDAAELVGIAAIVASLIFVGLQMKQAQEIGNAERRLTQVANGIELSTFINEFANIWVKGNAGNDLDDSEAVIFENLVLTKTRYHQHQARAARHLGADVGETVHRGDLVYFLYSNPGARRVWVAQRERSRRVRALLSPGISGTFADEVLSALATLDEAQF